jgi:NADPH:quinone reductase
VRVVLMREFGPPEVLAIEAAPDPVPEAGQAVIDVSTAGITFVETQVRSGSFPFPGSGPPLPIIPGNGVGGVVTAVGSGVDDDLIGRRVISSTGGSGGYAEQVAVDAAGLIEIPDDLDFAQAVAMLADGRTAMALIESTPLYEGQHVLIEAAGGGVGTLLVQLAANAGSRVVAAAGDQRKLDLARDLGASATVNYSKPDWADQVQELTSNTGLDVVFDGVGGEIGRRGFELMAPHSRFTSFGMSSGSPTEASIAELIPRGLTVIGGLQVRSPDHNRELVEKALAEAAAGRIRPVIGQTFPLERAADAHAAIESRATLGKTILVVERRS